MRMRMMRMMEDEQRDDEVIYDDVKNGNCTVAHVIQQRPDLTKEQAEELLELLIDGFTDADGNAAEQAADEASAEDIDAEPNNQKSDEQARDKHAIDRRAMDEQERAGDGRAGGGRASKGRAKMKGGLPGTTWLSHGACRGRYNTLACRG
jgi:hypothetical protein